mgnify:CR=1 FL=1
MKTVQQIMQETGAEANIRNFRYMQENYTYKQKIRHAENVARSYQDKCSEMGLNCHISVGGLDSITLHYFLEACGVHVPCVSCSSLEQKGVQAVHKQIAAEMESTYSAREWLGAHMALPQDVLHWTRKTPNGKIKPLVAEMVSDFNDSVYKPLGHDSDTQDGLNVHGGLLDEIHAWAPPMRALYDVIVDGVTAREQPMIFETTTAGTVREGLYDDLYQEAENVINGFYDDNGYKNEHFLPVIYELDSRKEWTDESCWAKANPGLGTIKSVEQLRAKVQKAIANPKLVKNLLCKDFNIPETIGEAWLTFEQLNNTATFDVRQLRPRYGIGGADFSSTTDLTAAVVIFMVPGDPHIYVLCMFWLPEELLERRVREDRIPYDLWKEQGYLRTCEGNKVRQKDVTEWFLEVQNELDCYIYCGGYDAWSASYWVDEMQDTFGKGVFVPVQQTMKTLSLPMKQLGADFDSKLIIYNNNPVLKWCLANTGIVEDKNGNIKPNKTSKARKRIDGLAALLDAFVVFQDRQDDYKTMI